MEFIDTHTHLYDEAFDADIAQVVMRMKEAGVCKCILPAIDMESYRRQSDFALANKGFAFEAIGLHPTSVNANWRQEIDFVEDELSKNKNRFKAVGEVGLDGYWSRDFMKEQIMLFKEQILLSDKYGLPLIIHIREATDELFAVLDSLRGLELHGVFHAFTGSVEMYKRIKRYGHFSFGIGGVVTYKNAGIAETIKHIPLSDILIETDSPWLTPVPFRGKRNESSYLTYIAEKIAILKGVDISEVAHVTSRNAESLFDI